ncbi:transglycosylase domain-containing protein [Actinomadura namibiensis]|uniref:Membrane peptidoglycan carboxypeptidase n=1 Tax=Actinomadura namibiensis TaxID=182080 RepID=A0A7W3QKL0_ACTNM|nr:transglycosylase domain-containing protein [Actinomadura namibiensis]MBA8950516.1 membrane peptidoglycan carboxypeptidase [Actinomadura namibiensis]
MTAGVTAVMVLAACVLVFVGYSMTPVPNDKDAQKDALTQGSVITYKDGKPLMRLGAKREFVAIKDVPPHVRLAVVAAEDREFYNSNLGISPKGMARALLKAATGESVEGGSTITQQLARNYYKGLSQDRTMSRKFKEIFIASKLGQSKKRDEILEMYLNTIPFGRNSLGIQMAARSYFRKDVKHLTVEEGALLAAMIQQPSYFKTQGDSEAAQALRNRWNYVLDGMVKMGKLDQAKRSAMQFPRTKQEWNDVRQDPQAIYIRDRVMFELNKIDPELARNADISGGIKIETSLDPQMMQFAIDAMKEQGVQSWPKHIGTGLIAVDSSNGEILAFYGGNPNRNQLASVFSPGAQVGSSFKPYVLAAALKQGHSVKSMISGKSPMCFTASGAVPGNCTSGGYPVRNDAGDPPFNVIDLVKATEKSVNTSYVKLGLEVGLDNVVKTAEAFGVPHSYIKPHANMAGLSLGISNIPPIYQAAGYAAFANGGTFREPHLITKVTKTDPVTKETRTVKLPWKKEQVLNAEQAAQANYAMRSVVTSGTGTAARLPDGRQVAGKTGTAEKNSAAWFVGYIPQVSTAVSMYNTKGVKPITGIPGFPQTRSVYGGTVPAKIWNSFMQKVIAHKNLEAKQFTPPTFTGLTNHQWDAPPPPKPTKKPTTPSETPSCQPTEPGTGNGDGQQPPNCRPTAPTEPTEPTSPPPSGGKPCTGPGIPVGCDPNKPPTDPNELKRWCRWNDHPSCPPKDPDGPGGPDDNQAHSRPFDEGV